jgi:hypothetical protein
MRSQRLKTGLPVKNTTDTAANTILTKTVRTKEKIRKKTRGLWDTARQLKGLSDLLASPEKEPEDMAGRYGPLIELTVAPADDVLELKTEPEATSPTGQSREKPQKAVMKSSGTSSVKSTKNTTKKDRKKPSSKTHPDTKPHDNKAADKLPADKAELPTDPAESLPDISVREILDELEEIEKLIRERQPD